MKPTISQILRNTVPPPPKDRFDGELVDVNYRSREMVVRIEGGSTIKVMPRHDMDLGTNDNPKVIAGGRVQVERIGDQYVGTMYVARLYLPVIGKSGGGRTPTAVLATPQWSTGYPRIRGTLIEGAWNVVPGAIAYRVWKNTFPAPNGATQFEIDFFQNSFSLQYNTGVTSELTQNGGFESGDFSQWNPSGANPERLFIETTIKYSGSYALKLYATTDGNCALINDPLIPIVAGNSYRQEFWYNVTSVGIGGSLSISYRWYDANKTIISSATLIVNSVTAGWMQSLNPAWIAPANSAYFSWAVGITGGAITAYADAFSLIGLNPVTGTTYVYAVQAIDEHGNTSGLSSWLAPIQQSASVGTPSAAYLEVDYANARLQSSNYVAATVGTKISANGVEGAVVVSAAEPSIMFPGQIWIDTT